MTSLIKPLPQDLIDRYKNWKSDSFANDRSLYENLALEGQSPPAMIISCCDSRVHATSMFGAETGEFFIHRNIANLIPPYNPDGDHHGTSAAIEFAICALKVSHIIILGHSSCGGIKNGYHICKGDQVNEELLFVNKWLHILKPAYDMLEQSADEKNDKYARKTKYYKFNTKFIRVSIYSKALSSNEISIHGLWNNIGTGELEMLNPKSMLFESL